MATISKRRGKRGITYRAQVRRSGTTALTKTFNTQEQAEQWAATQEAGLVVAQKNKTVGQFGKTLDQLVSAYITKSETDAKIIINRNKRTNLEWWRTQLGNERLIDITRWDIEARLDMLLAGNKRLGGNIIRQSNKPIAGATVNRYKAALSVCLKWGVKKGWLDTNPAADIDSEPESAGGRALTPDERVALLDAVDQSAWPGLPVLVRLALDIGARRGELLSLRWADVDLKLGKITFPKTKNGDKRETPIAGLDSLDYLRNWAKVRPIDDNARVFPIDPKKHWDRALRESGIQHFRFHDLRHTCGTELVEAGVPTVTVAKILGHKTLEMVMRYAHPAEEAKRDALQMMAERVRSRQ